MSSWDEIYNNITPEQLEAFQPKQLAPAQNQPGAFSDAPARQAPVPFSSGSDFDRIYNSLTPEQLQPFVPVDRMDSTVFDRLPDENEEEANGSPLLAGLRGGVRNISANSTASRALLGKMFGSEEMFNESFQSYTEKTAENERIRKEENFATWQDVKDADGLWDTTGEFLEWLPYIVGEQAPNMVAMVAGGGVGGMILKGLLKGAITKGTANAAAVFAVSSGLASGEIAGEQLTSTGDIDIPVTLLASGASGALESITPILLGRATGLFGDDALQVLNRANDYIDQSASRWTQAGKSFVVTGFVEGVTEVAQEAINISVRSYVDENYSWASPDVKDRLEVAFVTGLFSGGTYGAAGRILRPTGVAGGQNPNQPNVENFPDLFIPEVEGQAVPEGSAGPGSLLAALYADRTELKPDAVRTEPYAPGVFVTSKQATADRPEVMEFQDPDDAFLTSIQDPDTGRDPERLVFVQMTEEAAAAADRSALLTDIPSGPLEQDTNVWFKEDSDMEQAIGWAKQAQDLNAAGKTDEARDAYTKALEAGFRYAPQSSGSVVVGMPEKGLRVVMQPEGSFPRRRFIDMKGTGDPVYHNYTRGYPDTNKDKTQVGFIRDIAYKEGKATDSVSDAFDLTGVTDQASLVEAVRKGVEAGDAEVSVPAGKTIEDFYAFIAEQTYVDEKGMLDAGFTVKAKADPIDKNSVQTLYTNEVLENSRYHTKLPLNRVDKLGVLPDLLTLDFDTSRDIILTRMFKRATSWMHMKNGKVADVVEAIERADSAIVENTVNIFLESSVAFKAKQKRLVNAAVKVMNVLQKRFAPDMTIVFQIVNERWSNVNGWQHTAHRDGKVVEIGLNLSDQGAYGSTLVKMAHTLTHEMGHALADRYLASPNVINSGLAANIYNSYLRFHQRAGILKANEHVAEGYSIFRGLVLHKDLQQGDQATFVAQPDLENGKWFAYEYTLNFNEWMAEQTAQYMEGHVTESLGQADGFFHWFKRKITQLIKTTQHLIPEYDSTPSSSMRLFLDSMHDGSIEVSDLGAKLADLQYSHSVWSKELGAMVDKSQPNKAKNVIQGLEARLSKEVLGQVNNEGRTVKEELGIMSDAMDYFNARVKWGWHVLQLAWKNKHISFLQEYVDKADLWQNEKNFWQSTANDTLRLWKGLGKERADKLGRLLFAMDQMVYLKKGEEARQPTAAEFQALVDSLKIDEGTLAVYEQVKGDFNAMLKRLEVISLNHLAKRVDPKGPIYLLEAQRIKKEFANLRNRPYFPHARFGSFAVVVQKKGKTVYVEHIEPQVLGQIAGSRGKTPKEVSRKVAELQKEFGAEYTVAPAHVPEEARAYQGMPIPVLQKIKDELGGTLSETQKQWIDTLMVEYSPSYSFRRRLQHRTNRPGYSQDAMRSYANYFWHGSNHMARISYGTDMREVIDEFKKDNSRRLRNGINTIKRGKMIEYLEDHLDSILNPKPDWAQARSVAFTWWLGFSPASAMLNFTQLPLVTVPYLSARFGDVQTIKEVNLAAFKLRRAYMKPEDFAKLTPEQQAKRRDDFRLIELGLQQGFLEESLAMELAGTAEGSNLVRARYGSVAQRGMSAFAHAAGWMFQASEKMNRRITFTAAVNLARQKPDAKYLLDIRQTMQHEFQQLVQKQGLSEIEATAFLAGKDAVRRTQFEYGAWARPRFMRGKKGVIFTFYMFLQNMLWTVGNSPGNKRVLLTMLLMGGLMGLPGAGDIEEVVEFIGRKLFGKRYKASEEISKFIIELTGDSRTADLMLHGAAREGFGMNSLGDMLGLPLPAFDMSASVGLGNVIPGLAESLNNDGTSFEEVFGRATTDVAGASLGIGINMLKFLGDTDLPIDDMKRWERAMPRAFKNVARGMRFTPPDSALAKVTGNFVTPEGRERSRSGNTIITFEGDNPEHMMEIALSMAGLQPTRLSRKWNEIIAKSETVTYWQVRRNMLTSQYWHSYVTKDPESRQDVIDAIRKFNKEIPFKEMAITRETINNSMKARKRVQLQREHGIEPAKMFNRLAQETGDLYYTGEEDNVILREETR